MVLDLPSKWWFDLCKSRLRDRRKQSESRLGGRMCRLVAQSMGMALRFRSMSRFVPCLKDSLAVSDG
jgi:hypothetical protein